MLDTLITSRTRLKMLLKFFINSHTRAYLREMAKEFGESTNAIRHELNNLTSAGYLIASESGRSILYQANTSHPLYQDLKNMIHKYLGIDRLREEVIEKVLGRLGTLKLAFITGDYAQGRDSGVIELVLVGHLDQAYLKSCVAKAERLIQRKVHTRVLTPEEFATARATLGADKALILWKE